MTALLAALAAAVVYVFASLRVLNQYERGVSFFLGKFSGTKGPGLVLLPAGFASMRRVSLRIVALECHDLRHMRAHDLGGGVALAQQHECGLSAKHAGHRDDMRSREPQRS